MFSHLFAYLFAYQSDINGATAVEYTLIVAGVALVISAGLITFGDTMQEMLETGLADVLN